MKNFLRKVRKYLTYLLLPTTNVIKMFSAIVKMSVPQTANEYYINNIKHYITKFPNQLEIVDSDDYFDVYHYNKNACQDARKIRGWIVDRASGVIASRSIPDIDEFVQDTYPNESEISKIFPLYECSTLRLWFNPYSNSWFLSTNRKIDALNSRWGSNPNTFGEIFNSNMKCEYDMYVSDISNELDCNYTYIYFQTLEMGQEIARPPQFDEAKTFSSHRINNLTGETDFITDPFFKQINPVDKLDWNTTDIGFYVVLANGYSFKYLKKEYQTDKTIRNNNPDLIGQYYDLINNNKLDDAHRLKELFKNYFVTFDYHINNAAKNIAKHHITYLTKKECYQIPSEQYNLYRKHKSGFFGLQGTEEIEAYAKLLILNPENAHRIYKSQVNM